MKKLLLFFAAILVAGSMWAEDIVWKWTSDTSMTSKTTYTYTSVSGDKTLTFVAGSQRDKVNANSQTINVNGVSTTYTHQLYMNGASSTDRKLSFTGISGNGYLTIVTGNMTAWGSDGSISINTAASGANATKVATVFSGRAAQDTVYKSGLIEGLSAATQYFIFFSIKTYILSVIWTPASDVDTPSISAENVTLEANATSGEIAYTISNPATGVTPSASITSGDWISNPTVNASNNKVTFDATANTGSSRTATITISYTGAQDKVVTISQKEYIDPSRVYTLPVSFDAYQETSAWNFNADWSSSDYTSASAYYKLLTGNSINSPIITFGDASSATITINARTTGGVSGESNVVLIKFGETTLGSIIVATNSLSSYTLNLSNIPSGNNRITFTSKEPTDSKGLGIRSISIVASNKPAAPTMTPDGGVITESTQVSISGNGTIYYTTNGDDPTIESNTYSAPIIVNSTCTIKAFVYSNNTSSDITTAAFTYVDLTNDIDPTWIAANQGLANATAYSSLPVTSDVNIALNKGTNENNAPKYYDAGNGLRLYSGNTLTLSSSKNIHKVILTFSETKYAGNITSNVGSYNPNGVVGTWGGNATSITFTEGNASDAARLQKIQVWYTPTETVYVPTLGKFVAVTSDGEYYATFSSDKITFWPNDVVVNTVVVNNDGSLTMFAGEDEVFEEDIVTISGKTVDGYYVPASTGILINSTDASASYYEVYNKTVEDVDADFNMLKPGKGAPTEGENCKFYRLAYDDYDAKTGLGFYYGPSCDNGQAFTCPAGIAYLAVPTNSGSGAPRRYLLDATEQTGTATDIESVEANAEDGKFFEDGKIYIRKNGHVFNAMGQMVK